MLKCYESGGSLRLSTSESRMCDFIIASNLKRYNIGKSQKFQLLMELCIGLCLILQDITSVKQCE